MRSKKIAFRRGKECKIIIWSLLGFRLAAGKNNLVRFNFFSVGSKRCLTGGQKTENRVA